MFRDQLAERLLEMGRTPDYVRLASDVLGIRGASVELAHRLVNAALALDDREAAWRRVGQRASLGAPHSPGTYVFRDANRRVLYVGTAVNLRRRLRGHFAARRWLSLKPALARVALVEWEVVGSEIEGLIREAMLIDELKPEVNVQVRTPTLGRRGIPQALLRDVLILVRSIDDDAVELVAARSDGRSLMQRTARDGSSLEHHVERLWAFFQTSGGLWRGDEGMYAPLVFSWLAGRGRASTRVDPHDAVSCAELGVRLSQLLGDSALFSERLVHK
jgi:hypothetical protein